jgi:hypothetical protein
MLIYSVTVNVEASAEAEWLSWMQQTHIPEVMATGKFDSYAIHKLEEPQPEDDSASYNILYTCSSQELLEQYRRQDAPALQQEHNDRFGNRTVAFRVILERIAQG